MCVREKRYLEIRFYILCEQHKIESCLRRQSFLGSNQVGTRVISLMKSLLMHNNSVKVREVNIRKLVQHSLLTWYTFLRQFFNERENFHSYKKGKLGELQLCIKFIHKHQTGRGGGVHVLMLFVKISNLFTTISDLHSG